MLTLAGHSRVLLTVGVAGLCLGGCAQESLRGPSSPTPAAVQRSSPHLLLRDGLDRELALVGEPDVKPPTRETAMSVRVRLSSASQKTQFVRYCFRFYGVDGEVQTQEPVWYTADIPPGQGRAFEARAIRMSAANWELEVANR